MSLAGLLSVAGAMAFRFRFGTTAAERAIRRWCVACLIVTGAALPAWLLLQAGDMADAGSLADTLAAVPAVLAQTRFGWLILGQGGCVLAAGFALGGGFGAGRRAVALGACLAGLGLQAGRTHAATSGVPLLLISELVHLGAAAAWLGALVPLLLVVRVAPVAAAGDLARRFSPYGATCVVLLAATAVIQFLHLVGGLAGLVGTDYGRLILGKTALFGALLVCAAGNRSRFVPGCVAGASGARRLLLTSIGVETGLGLAVVLLAGVLAQTSPAMHVQPVWPFAWRFSLETVQEDPDFRAEVLEAGAALVVSVLLLGAAVVWRRRWRFGLALAGLAIAWFATPHLSLLLVPANPDSFVHSPNGFAAASILRGQALYPGACAACHGPAGRGDGPAGAGLAVPPADLTAAHLWGHADGELFWWLSHGITAPDGSAAMPGFAATLSPEDRWALIDFLRARNAGYRIGAADGWPLPVQAPELGLDCLDGVSSLFDLRGHPVLLRFSAVPPTAVGGLRTVWIDPGARAEPGVCAATDPAAGAAYGWVTGLHARLPGAELLVDPGGWLGALQRPGAIPGWTDPAALQTALRNLAAHPVARLPPMDMSMPGMAM